MTIPRKLIASLGALMTLWFTTSIQAAAKLNMTPGVTDNSNQIYDLHMLVVWIMTAIAVIVFGAMFYSILMHRKSKHPKPATFSHSTKMEIIWTVIPFVILAVLSAPAIKLLLEVEDTSDSDMTIQVTGYQWKWHYRYLNDELEEDIAFFSNLSTPRDQIEGRAPKGENYLLEVDNQLVIPKGQKVRFLVTAEDVLHAWWVPALGVKKDAIPGFINETWTRANETGVFRGQCAELCGKDHGFMPIVVKVVEENEYKLWMANKIAERAAEQEQARLAGLKSRSMQELMDQGKEVYLAKCAACHGASGAGIPGAFPSLIGSQVIVGPVEGHIGIVVNGKSGTAMQAFGSQLSDEELASVITYERNAWGNDSGDLVQTADIQAFKAGN